MSRSGQQTMRFYAAPVAIFGVVVILSGILKVYKGAAVPGAIGTGAAFLFFAALLFGLSFIPRPVLEPDAPPPMSAFERIIGLFYQPSAVFRNLRVHPRWLVAILLVTLFTSVYSIAFTKRVGAEKIAAQVYDKLEEKGWMQHEQAQKQKQDQIMAATVPIMIAEGVGKSVVGAFALAAFISGVFMLLVLMFGGKINYWQAFSVAAHAGLPVVVIKKSLSLLLLYLKDPIDIHPLLGQDGLVMDNLGLLVSPTDHPALYVIASVIGVLALYGLWLNATGLHNAGTKVSKGAAWGVTLTVTVVAVLLGAVWVSIFPVL